MKDAVKCLEKHTGPVTVGMLIRSHRTTHDLSQDDLAKKLKVTVGFISNIETGKKKLSLSNVLKICKVLKENERFWMSIYFEEEAREAGLKNIKVSVSKMI